MLLPKPSNRSVERVKQRAAVAAPNEWVLGWGWDEGKWAEHYPSVDVLTAAAPNNPVYLAGLHGFAAWVNQKALVIAGINKNTPDPENGKILRDSKTGETRGVLLNRAQELVARHIPPLTLAQVKQAIELAAGECVRHGLTSVHEARVTPIMIQAFRELIQERRLPLRVYLMLDGANKALVEEWLHRGPEIDRRHQITIRAVKVFADGASRARTPGGRFSERALTCPSAQIFRVRRSILSRESMQPSRARIHRATRRAVGIRSNE